MEHIDDDNFEEGFEVSPEDLELTQQALDELLADGEIEIVGYVDGEPTYKITEKGEDNFSKRQLEHLDYLEKLWSGFGDNELQAMGASLLLSVGISMGEVESEYKVSSELHDTLMSLADEVSDELIRRGLMSPLVKQKHLRKDYE